MTSDAAYEHRLNIENISEADYGEYVCEATNALGAERSSVRLTGERARRVTGVGAGLIIRDFEFGVNAKQPFSWTLNV